jgi:hypothetical protein
LSELQFSCGGIMGIQSNTRLLALMCVLVLVAATSSYAEYFNYAGSTLWSYPTDLCVKDGLLYTSYVNGLAIYDLSQPIAPVLLGKKDLPGYGFSVAVEGNYAYISDREYGTAIINVISPQNPRIIGYHQAEGQSIHINTGGHFAFVGSHNLEIVDISNPQNTTTIGSLPSEMSCGVYKAPTLFTAGAPGLNIIDLSNPAMPSLIGSCAVPCGSASDVAIRDNFAYLAAYGDGIQIINISNLSAPTLAGSLAPGGQSIKINLDGDFAYILSLTGVLDGVLDVINIQNPNSPALVYSLSLPSRCLGMDIYGDYIYLSGYKNDIVIIDKSEPANPSIAATYDVPETPNSVAADNEIAYVMAGIDGFYIVDIQNRENPEVIGRNSDPVFRSIGAIKNNVLYVNGNGNSLDIFDVSNRAEPVFQRNIEVDNRVMAIMFHSNLMLISGQDTDPVSIYNISDPLLPVKISTYTHEDNCMGMYMSGNYLFLTNLDNSTLFSSGSLEIVNLSIPASPQLISTLSFAKELTCVYVAGNYAILGSSSGLELVDVSNLESPVFMRSIDLGNSGPNFVVKEQYLYALNGAAVYIFDVTNPANPIQLDRFKTPGEWAEYGSITSDNYLVLTNRMELLILKSLMGNPGNCHYHIGDINGDQNFNGLDVVFGVGYFKGMTTPDQMCECTSSNAWYVQGDVNGSCNFNGIDVTSMVNYFKGGPVPIPCPDCPPQE